MVSLKDQDVVSNCCVAHYILPVFQKTENLCKLAIRLIIIYLGRNVCIKQESFKIRYISRKNTGQESTR